MWFGADRSAWSETGYRKIKNDFGGWLLLTSDLDWQEKWETSPGTVPCFNEAQSVQVGEKIVILTFFVNPKTNQNYEAHVLCDIKVTRPDNTISINYKDITCIEGKLQGKPNYIRLSPVIINFSGEATDPKGIWTVEAELHDVIRKTALNLKTSFVLKEN